MTMNAGYLFNKKYYADLHQGKINTTLNREIEGMGEEVLEMTAPLLGFYEAYNQQSFCLKTTYPGLLTGSGYLHEASGDENAYKLGFQFDHTTGLPIIPGHAIKGVLKSAFGKTGFIKHYLKGIGKAETGEDELSDLIDEIFDGTRNGQSIPTYEQDCFMEAVPVKILVNNLSTNKKRIFGPDYITPHKNNTSNAKDAHDWDEFSNPVPIKFLKVMPEVVYKFYFKLHDSQVIPAITADVKRELFQETLEIFGVGAKTNVGYGQLSRQLEVKENEYPSQVSNESNVEEEEKTVKKKYEQALPPTGAAEYLIQGAKFFGKVYDKEGDYMLIGFNVMKKYDCIIKKKYDSIKKKDKSRLTSIDEIAENDEVLITVNKPFDLVNNLNCSVKLISK